MKSYHEALATILIEAGVRRREAFRICRLIEGDDRLAVTSDDVAGCILRWKDRLCNEAADEVWKWTEAPLFEADPRTRTDRATNIQ